MLCVLQQHLHYLLVASPQVCLLLFSAFRKLMINID